MTERTLTVPQQTLEAWINNHEEQGRFLNEMGIISDEELAAAIQKDEKIKLVVQLDPALAKKVLEEYQAGDEEQAEQDLRDAAGVQA